MSHLQHETGDDGGHVAVAGAFAVAVDGSLHLHRARFDGRQRVGDADARIVVRVNADGALHLLHDVGGDAAHFAGHRTAVRVAQHHDVGPGILRGLERGQRVLRVILVTVEEMFGVVNDFLAVLLEIADRLADHREVFFGRRADYLAHVQRPRFAHERDHGRVGLHQHVDLRIVLALRVCAPRAAEGGDLRVLEFSLGRFREEIHVLRVRPRPAAFDVMHAERIEPLGDADLVRARKRDAFALRAVAQRRVVDGDFPVHSPGAKTKTNRRARQLRIGC